MTIKAPVHKDRESKKQFSVVLDASLMKAFDDVTELTGVTKMAIVKQAIENYIAPFLDDKGNFNPKKAKLRTVTNVSKDGIEDYTEVPCTVLNKCTMMGNPYYSVYADGTFKKVPAANVIM